MSEEESNEDSNNEEEKEEGEENEDEEKEEDEDNEEEEEKEDDDDKKKKKKKGKKDKKKEKGKEKGKDKENKKKGKDDKKEQKNENILQNKEVKNEFTPKYETSNTSNNIMFNGNDITVGNITPKKTTMQLLLEITSDMDKRSGQLNGIVINGIIPQLIAGRDAGYFFQENWFNRISRERQTDSIHLLPLRPTEITQRAQLWTVSPAYTS